jgi:hypothetical protein
MADEKRKSDAPAGDYAINPRLGIPKQVAWSLGAGVLGIVVGGALVGFGAAVAVPAIRSRLRKRTAAKPESPEPAAEG